MADRTTAVNGALMVCGTTSDAGKTTLVAGLCRVLARRGVTVAPFKGQNMSLNAMVTSEGGEIGRAQWLQAVAAGAEPEVAMNPVLLKPMGERASQVVLLGRSVGVLEAAPYQASKDALVDVVDGALASLRARFDVVVCEGAGSPAEINLLEHDIVNLGLAFRGGLPAIVVGDIERGGVFAHLFGTVAILPEELAQSIGGFVINRFRGDPTLLGDGPAQLEARTGVPTLGVLPFLEGLEFDAEDSLARSRTAAPSADRSALDVAVLLVPRLSNFTDLDPLVAEPGVHVRWVARADELGHPDLVVLPGTRATVSDLASLRQRGLCDAVEALRASADPPMILGICGGFQMLGMTIEDAGGVEAAADSASVSGLGWLPVRTVFEEDKWTRLTITVDANGRRVGGYEIRHGRMVAAGDHRAWLEPEDRDDLVSAGDAEGMVLGTTLHGLFEDDGFRHRFLAELAGRRGRTWAGSHVSFAAARQGQIDRIADACEEHLDLEALWRLVESAAPR
jgi:adenosylcobyric acid synthase